MAELHSVARRRRGASRAEAGDTAGEMAAAVSAAAEDEEEAKAKEGTCEWVVELSVKDVEKEDRENRELRGE